MSDPALFRLRCTFCKQGRLALLSHLEICRALERAVRRADLPYAVSQGFSPHMRISFGAALPVGVGGTEEIFDIFFTRYVAPQKALAALQAASAPDLMVTSAQYVEHTAKAASVALPVSTYAARLSAEPGSGAPAFAVPEEVRVVRKKKEKVLRIADFLVGPVSVEGPQVVFTLESRDTGSLRADVFLQACLDASNAAAPDLPPIEVLSVTRTAQRESR